MKDEIASFPCLEESKDQYPSNQKAKKFEAINNSV